jgi:hypothetical protein
MLKSGYRPPYSDANGRDLCASSGFRYRALQLNLDDANGRLSQRL